MRPKKFSDPKYGTLREAQCQVADAAHWARKAGFNNVADRLKWAADVLLKYVDQEDAKSVRTLSKDQGE